MQAQHTPQILLGAADEIMEALLPQHMQGFGPHKEYQVRVDELTDSIIIHNDIIGFAVTRLSVDEGVHLDRAKSGFGNLVKATEQARYVKSLQGVV